MKYFNLSIGTLILRFYLMMLIVILAFVVGKIWLSVFALPVLLSCMLGIKLWSKKAKVETGGPIHYDEAIPEEQRSAA